MSISAASMRPLSLRLSDLDRFHTLVFAGGGNRCMWQAGVVTWLRQQGFQLPSNLVGTSAGAGVAAALLAQRAEHAFEVCKQLYAGNAHLVNRDALKRLQLRFGHEHIFPAWIAAYINADTFEALRSSGTRLRVAITHPSRWLGVKGSVVAATLAYMVDKHVVHSIHPRLPKWLGLKQGFFDLQDCATVEEAQRLLYVAGSAAPFMPLKRWRGATAMDGGYIDNAPIPQQSQEERASTLVLLTRHYPALPATFWWRDRSYWQPSRPIPVSTFDCTPRTTIEGAWGLGESDANILFGSAAQPKG